MTSRFYTVNYMTYLCDLCNYKLKTFTSLILQTLRLLSEVTIITKTKMSDLNSYLFIYFSEPILHLSDLFKN